MLADTAQLALDTILGRPAAGIPTFFINLMEHAHLERLAGARPGTIGDARMRSTWPASARLA